MAVEEGLGCDFVCAAVSVEKIVRVEAHEGGEEEG